LKKKIVERLKAQAQRAEQLETVAAISEVKSTEGLSTHEIAVLVAIMSDQASPGDSMVPHKIKEMMKRSGYTSIACGLAMESLKRKDMIDVYEEQSGYNSYTVCRLTPKGVDWLLANQDRFYMRRPEEPVPPQTEPPINDEDIPF